MAGRTGMASYHQKHELPSDLIELFEDKAESQEQKILAFIQEYFTLFTVETLEEYEVLPPGTPHSSYIRAVANLRSSGKIQVVDQVPGRYGRPINLYQVLVRRNYVHS